MWILTSFSCDVLAVGGTVHQSFYLEQESMVQVLICGLLAVYWQNFFFGWVTSV